MADGGTSDAGSGHRLPRAVGRWAAAGPERGLVGPGEGGRYAFINPDII